MENIMREFDEKFKNKQIKQFILDNFVPKESYYDLFNETAKHYEDRFKEGFYKGYEAGRISVLENLPQFPDRNDNL